MTTAHTRRVSPRGTASAPSVPVPVPAIIDLRPTDATAAGATVPLADRATADRVAAGRTTR